MIRMHKTNLTSLLLLPATSAIKIDIFAIISDTASKQQEHQPGGATRTKQALAPRS
jgi:hypothetical protein